MTAIPYQELELKAVVPDPAELIRRLLAGGASVLLRGDMEDRRYDRRNELTLRDEVLRTRLLSSEDGRRVAILGWKGPARISPEGYKLRDELEYPIEGSVPPDSLLLALGYSLVHSIQRRIEVFQLGEASVRLEYYPHMDVLVEIEGVPAAIERAIVTSGIPRDHFMADSLTDFIARFEQRTGQRAVVGQEL